MPVSDYYRINRVTLREFTPDDAQILKERAINPVSNDWHVWAQHFHLLGPAYIGYYRGELLGAIGIAIKDPGKGTVWAVFTPAVRKYPKAILYCIRDMMRIMMKICGLTKLRAYSDAGFEASQNLLEHAGFRQVRRFKNFYYYRYEV